MTATAPPSSTELAIQRTWLAHERTLMAWVRTSTSMISFGFTIYKFFQFDLEGKRDIPHGVLTPRDFAVAMISIGILALAAAVISNRIGLREMAAYGYKKRSLAEIVAGVVSAFGIVALITAIMRA